MIKSAKKNQILTLLVISQKKICQINQLNSSHTFSSGATKTLSTVLDFGFDPPNHFWNLAFRSLGCGVLCRTKPVDYNARQEKHKKLLPMLLHST